MTETLASADGQTPATTPPTNSATLMAQPYPQVLGTPQFRQAAKAMNAAENSKIDFSTPDGEKQFEDLVVLNAKVGIVDDPQGFLAWWSRNRQDVLNHFQNTDMNPQQILMTALLKYHLLKANSTGDTSEIVQWMKGIVASPIVSKISSWSSGISTAVLVWLTVSTVNQIASAVLKPISDYITNYLAPITQPLKDRIALIGGRHFGAFNRRMNESLFINAKAKLASVEGNLDQIHQTVIDQRLYSMSPEDIAMFLLKMQTTSLNVADATGPTEGINRGMGLTLEYGVNQPRDFAMAVGTSMTNSETYRQGAWTELYQIENRNHALANQIESVGTSMEAAIENKMVADREGQAEKSQAARKTIANLKAEIINLGGTPRQAGIIEDKLSTAYTFRQQTAAILAGNMYHDLTVQGLTAEIKEVFAEMKKNSCLPFFLSQLQGEVKESANRMGLQLEMQKDALNTLAAAPVATEKPTVKKPNALELIKRVVASPEGEHALAESDALGRKESLREPSAREIRR